MAPLSFVVAESASSVASRQAERWSALLERAGLVPQPLAGSLFSRASAVEKASEQLEALKIAEAGSSRILAQRANSAQSISSSTHVSVPALVGVLSAVLALVLCYGLWQYINHRKATRDPYTSGNWGDNLDQATVVSDIEVPKYSVQPNTSKTSGRMGFEKLGFWQSSRPSFQPTDPGLSKERTLAHMDTLEKPAAAKIRMATNPDTTWRPQVNMVQTRTNPTGSESKNKPKVVFVPSLSFATDDFGSSFPMHLQSKPQGQSFEKRMDNASQKPTGFSRSIDFIATSQPKGILKPSRLEPAVREDDVVESTATKSDAVNETQELVVVPLHISAPATPRSASLAPLYSAGSSLSSPISGIGLTPMPPSQSPGRSTVTVLSPLHPEFPSDLSSDVVVDVTAFPRLVKVIGTFQPSMPDELALAVGDTMRLVHVFPDEWCLVQRLHLVEGKEDKSASEVEMETGAVPLLCLTELNGKAVTRASSAASPAAVELLEQEEASEIPQTPLSDTSSRATVSSRARSQKSGASSGVTKISESTGVTQTTASRSDSDFSASRSHWSSATTNLGSAMTPLTEYSLASIKESPHESDSPASSPSSSAAQYDRRRIVESPSLSPTPPTPASAGSAESGQSLEVPGYIQHGHGAGLRGDDRTSFAIPSASVFGRRKHESSGYAFMREALHRNVQRLEEERAAKIQAAAATSTRGPGRKIRAQTMRPEGKKGANFSAMFDLTRAS